MDFVRCWSSPRKRNCNSWTTSQFGTQQRSQKVMNFLAANARVNRKKVLGLEMKSAMEEENLQVNEPTSSSTPLTLPPTMDVTKFDAAFTDVNDKIRKMELSLNRIQDVSVDVLVGTKLGDYDEKVKDLLKESEKSMHTSLHRAMKVMMKEMGKSIDLVVVQLNEAIENKMQELSESMDKKVKVLDTMVHSMDDKQQAFQIDVNDRLEAEEEATQCFIADFNFKNEVMMEKMMKAHANTARAVEARMISECKQLFMNFESRFQNDKGLEKKPGKENARFIPTRNTRVAESGPNWKGFGKG